MSLVDIAGLFHGVLRLLSLQIASISPPCLHHFEEDFLRLQKIFVR